MRQLHDLEDADVDLDDIYFGLMGGRVYFGPEEAIDSISGISRRTM